MTGSTELDVDTVTAKSIHIRQQGSLLSLQI